MKVFSVMALMVLTLCSCAVNTPQSRISKNGGMYSKLSSEHRSMVARGEITEGMSKDAVYLAWGSPSKIYKMEEEGTSKERWVYTQSKTAPSTSIGIGYGGSPRYRRWGYTGGLHYGSPHRVYVPEEIAAVIFHRDKVESWEQKQ